MFPKAWDSVMWKVSGIKDNETVWKSHFLFNSLSIFDDINCDILLGPIMTLIPLEHIHISILITL